jgi:hypothetical protein
VSVTASRNTSLASKLPSSRLLAGSHGDSMHARQGVSAVGLWLCEGLGPACSSRHVCRAGCRRGWPARLGIQLHGRWLHRAPDHPGAHRSQFSPTHPKAHGCGVPAAISCCTAKDRDGSFGSHTPNPTAMCMCDKVRRGACAASANRTCVPAAAGSSDALSSCNVTSSRGSAGALDASVVATAEVSASVPPAADIWRSSWASERSSRSSHASCSS